MTPREYYLQNKERFRERNRLYYAQNKEKLAENRKRNKTKKKQYMTDWMLKTKYGITESEYNDMFQAQDGCCAICKRAATYYKRKMAVDHNHLTGKVRGLLCVKCNRGIGCFEESPSMFDSAKSYLLRFN